MPTHFQAEALPIDLFGRSFWPVAVVMEVSDAVDNYNDHLESTHDTHAPIQHQEELDWQGLWKFLPSLGRGLSRSRSNSNVSPTSTRLGFIAHNDTAAATAAANPRSLASISTEDTSPAPNAKVSILQGVMKWDDTVTMRVDSEKHSLLEEEEMVGSLFAEAHRVEPEARAVSTESASSEGQNGGLQVGTVIEATSNEMNLKAAQSHHTSDGTDQVEEMIFVESSNDTTGTIVETPNGRDSSAKNHSSNNKKPKLPKKASARKHKKKDFKTMAFAANNQPKQATRKLHDIRKPENSKKNNSKPKQKVAPRKHKKNETKDKKKPSEKNSFDGFYEHKGEYEIQVACPSNDQASRAFRNIPLGPHDVLKGQNRRLRYVPGNKRLREEAKSRYEDEYLPANKKRRTKLYEDIRNKFKDHGGRFWEQLKGQSWWTEMKDPKRIRDMVATKFKDGNKKNKRREENCTDEALKATRNELEQTTAKKPGGFN